MSLGLRLSPMSETKQPAKNSRIQLQASEGDPYLLDRAGPRPLKRRSRLLLRSES